MVDFHVLNRLCTLKSLMSITCGRISCTGYPLQTAPYLRQLHFPRRQSWQEVPAGGDRVLFGANCLPELTHFSLGQVGSIRPPHQQHDVSDVTNSLLRELPEWCGKLQTLVTNSAIDVATLRALAALPSLGVLVVWTITMPAGGMDGEALPVLVNLRALGCKLLDPEHVSDMFPGITALKFDQFTDQNRSLLCPDELTTNMTCLSGPDKCIDFDVEFCSITELDLQVTQKFVPSMESFVSVRYLTLRPVAFVSSPLDFVPDRYSAEHLRAFLRAVVDGIPLLCELNLGGWVINGVTVYLSQLTSLTHLTLHNCVVSQQVLGRMLQAMPRIQYIQIKHCRGITKKQCDMVALRAASGRAAGFRVVMAPAFSSDRIPALF